MASYGTGDMQFDQTALLLVQVERMDSNALLVTIPAELSHQPVGARL